MADALKNVSPQTNLSQVSTFVSTHSDTYPLISPTTANLAGKSVFIAGASRGVGWSTALRYAIAGCSKIAIGARSPLGKLAAEIKSAALSAGRPEPQVLALHLDVTSEDSVKAAYEAITAAFGPALDVLIANAGYMEEWAPIAEMPPANWWRHWEVNLKGTHLLAHYFIPALLQSETRTLLTLSSIGAHGMSIGASAYQAGKFAVARLTEFADAEYGGPGGLVAISLHPGGVKTELAMNLPGSFHQYMVDTPELPGDFMVWLGRERREWLSGRHTSANWDVGELEGRKAEILEKNLLKFRLTI
ncbi:hypothetical protein B0T17DRAFT_545924 [Bombardia bombarda]|uniref:NAD(P)-binding protein n=1 Tax=Bombardia bombarda TaxID=252184 RepID=A0AA39U1Z1_9PEZI|nr:hypothetical protein B0T17DRAFT_545924 [Bombardia bombarda]